MLAALPLEERNKYFAPGYLALGASYREIYGIYDFSPAPLVRITEGELLKYDSYVSCLRASSKDEILAYCKERLNENSES